MAVDPQALLLVQIIFTQSQNNPKFCIAMVIFDVNATFQRSPILLLVHFSEYLNLGGKAKIR